ncbi:MAG: tRNA (adenosine(37)-N6)-threonylcarbamoyltransferase complex transferase subunit TsaD [Burkholderiaceae bacterium]
MHILGIETSCDETGLALIEVAPAARPGGLPAVQVVSEALHTQMAMHAAYGGVVPELASRDHLLRINPLLDRILNESGRTLSDIDVIAYTQGPGLAGALLVGASLAHGLGAGLGRPVIGVHHLEGHLVSPLLSPDLGDDCFPFLALLVSGGHTQIMAVEALGSYRLLGETIDDAAGEAFDKSAQIMGLGYPGGPQIAQWAARGSTGRFSLPRPLKHRATLDFSFAGLKTAVLTQAKKCPQPLSDQDRADLAAETQAAIVEVLVSKCTAAMEETGISRLVVAGGVSANVSLRQQLETAARQRGGQAIFPPPALCTDNGVMIAWVAALRILNGLESAHPAGAFGVRPRWPLSEMSAPRDPLLNP